MYHIVLFPFTNKIKSIVHSDNEVFQVSGSSTSSFDLARSLDTGFFSSAMVFKNGLNVLNMTALSDTASNNNEYAIANNGAGSVGRITFGGNLENGDAVLVMYFT